MGSSVMVVKKTPIDVNIREIEIDAKNTAGR
jgi:hypothetical protein